MAPSAGGSAPSAPEGRLDAEGRRWLVGAALLGAISVAAGAFGAHALREVLAPRMLEVFETGLSYARFHVLGLGLVALLSGGGRRRTVSGALFGVGTLLFTGSLWTLALGGPRWVGAITPLGGLSLIAGWLALGAAAMGAPGSWTPPKPPRALGDSMGPGGDR